MSTKNQESKDPNPSPGGIDPKIWVPLCGIRGRQSAPPIQVSMGPPIVIVRDSFGNALGGLRLPDFDVPIGTNNGSDNGGPSFCVLYGFFKPFDETTLLSLYPTHDAYVHAFKHATHEALKYGYIVKEDAEEMIENAVKAEIP